MSHELPIAHRVEQLEDGLDTPITDETATFSTGEIVLFCLASTLLLQPDILLIDELDSFLDSSTKLAVELTMKEVLPNSTIIVISHKGPDPRIYDRVITFESLLQ